TDLAAVATAEDAAEQEADRAGEEGAGRGPADGCAQLFDRLLGLNFEAIGLASKIDPFSRKQALRPAERTGQTKVRIVMLAEIAGQNSHGSHEMPPVETPEDRN